jgi:hypothetical protein
MVLLTSSSGRVKKIRLCPPGEAHNIALYQPPKEETFQGRAPPETAAYAACSLKLDALLEEAFALPPKRILLYTPAGDVETTRPRKTAKGLSHDGLNDIFDAQSHA